jgi:hypothetical protein
MIMTKQFQDMNFIEQLEELKSTLQEAMVAENSRLEMDTWITEEPTHHFCDSACCILGYQAVKISTTEFEGNVVGLARDLIWGFDDVCEKTIGYPYLAFSVYEAGPEGRLWAARRTNLFTKEELDLIVHLNSDNPTFQDAIDYLDICIAKTKEYLLNKGENV